MEFLSQRSSQGMQWIKNVIWFSPFLLLDMSYMNLYLSNENKMLLVVYFVLKAVFFTNLTALRLVLQWNR